MSTENPEHPNILVPIDLTDTSPIAIEHAFHIAQKADAELYFHHWVADADEMEQAAEKMRDLICECENRLDTQMDFIGEIEVGDPMQGIEQVAKDIQPMLIIIGTHGLQGFEYFKGTHAIRIVGDAEVPVMVVQEQSRHEGGYQHITVPVELEAETKQKLPVVAYMAKLFDAQVHLFIPSEDDDFHRNALQRNLRYAEQYLEERGVKYHSSVSSEGRKDMEDAVEEQVEEHPTDLIILTNWHESKVIDLFGTEETQEIMLNEEKIPVILVNPTMVGVFDLFGWEV